MPEMPKKTGSKISDVEWGLVIGALVVVDLVQIGLDLLFQVGVLLNRFIDIFVGMSFAFYLQMRGQSMTDPKRIAGLVATFVGEEIPDVDALPFWTLDGIFNMMMSKSDALAAQIPGGSKVMGAVEKGIPKTPSLTSPNAGGASRPRTLRGQIDQSTQQIRDLNTAIRNKREMNQKNESEDRDESEK